MLKIFQLKNIIEDVCVTEIPTEKEPNGVSQHTKNENIIHGKEVEEINRLDSKIEDESLTEDNNAKNRRKIIVNTITEQQQNGTSLKVTSEGVTMEDDKKITEETEKVKTENKGNENNREANGKNLTSEEVRGLFNGNTEITDAKIAGNKKIEQETGKANAKNVNENELIPKTKIKDSGTVFNEPAICEREIKDMTLEEKEIQIDCKTDIEDLILEEKTNGLLDFETQSEYDARKEKNEVCRFSECEMQSKTEDISKASALFQGLDISKARLNRS